MNTRKARLIRAGILAARDPELAQYAHLGHRIVREAFAETLRRQQIRRLRRARAERARAAQYRRALDLLNSTTIPREKP